MRVRTLARGPFAQTPDLTKQTGQVKVLESQVNSGGKDATKVQDMKTSKRIRILENRLDHALVRFNEALAVNKQLREEIDHLRRERVVFDNINRSACCNTPSTLKIWHAAPVFQRL